MGPPGGFPDDMGAPPGGGFPEDPPPDMGPDDGFGAPPDDGFGPPPGGGLPGAPPPGPPDDGVGPPGDEDLLAWQAAVEQAQRQMDEGVQSLEHARGTPDEAAWVEELQHLQASLHEATEGLVEHQQYMATNAAPAPEAHQEAPPAAKRGWGHVAAANASGSFQVRCLSNFSHFLSHFLSHFSRSSQAEIGISGLVAQVGARQYFDHFDEGRKGYLDGADITASIHYLGYDCDEDYCTQLLATFALAAEVMDPASFQKMWEHLGTEAEPLPVSAQPDPPPAHPLGMSPARPAGGGGAPAAPPADVEVDEAHMAEWREQRLTELKAAEEERLLEEVTTHSNDLQ